MQLYMYFCTRVNKALPGTFFREFMAKKKKTAVQSGGWQAIARAGGWKEVLRGDTLRFVSGLLSLCVSLLMLLSFTSYIFTGNLDQAAVEAGCLETPANMCGKAGAYLSYYFMNDCFGVGAYFIPVFLLLLGLKLVKAYRVRLWKSFLHCAFLMVWVSAFLALLSGQLPEAWFAGMPFRPGGRHGAFVTGWLLRETGAVGCWMAMVASAILYLVYLSRKTIDVVRRLLRPQEYLKRRKHPEPTPEAPGAAAEPVTPAAPATEPEEETGPVSLNFSHEAGDDGSTALVLDPGTEETQPDIATADGREAELVIEPAAEEEKADAAQKQPAVSSEPYDPKKDLENYRYPTLDLLRKYDNAAPTIDIAEQNANKDRIITVLRNFDVRISSIKATIGPTITLYEITPAEGVRINKIRNLENDIALSLSALGIRIIAPIPGKGTIGIEVPNKNPRIVSMESVLNSRKFQESTCELPLALGKTITNEVFMVDLAKMPHLLVAGATGQGKSVGLNAVVTSLIYKKHPAELKFVIIDPKKVEFSIYAPIEKQFLAKIPGEDDPIITDVTKVVQTLKSLCRLMDHRYDLLKKAKTRNIKEYNAKFCRRELSPMNGHEFMPYIVVIIDEFGDLIMTAGKDVEMPIARIAQLARAVGIHMVIATQRPTTNIITGTIKANFPARMAFKVASQTDSRTILDRGGANQLVGKGDMLFLSGNDPVRVQCAFIDTPEVERINEFVAAQQGYPAPYELPEAPLEEGKDAAAGAFDADNLDSMFEDAARLVVVHQQGSTSLIQRKFAIGYNRAGRLMDQLEKAGIVGPAQGSKPREVLCADEAELEMKISAFK